MGAARDLLCAQEGEPAFDEIQPRGAGRREGHVEPRMSYEPAADAGSCVRAVVVENQMDIEICGDARIDGIEEVQELLAAVPPMAFANDLARGDVERGEQRGRAVPAIVVRPPSGEPNVIGRIGAARSSA